MPANARLLFPSWTQSTAGLFPSRVHQWNRPEIAGDGRPKPRIPVMGTTGRAGRRSACTLVQKIGVCRCFRRRSHGAHPPEPGNCWHFSRSGLLAAVTSAGATGARTGWRARPFANGTNALSVVSRTASRNRLILPRCADQRVRHSLSACPLLTCSRIQASADSGAIPRHAAISAVSSLRACR